MINYVLLIYFFINEIAKDPAKILILICFNKKGIPPI